MLHDAHGQVLVAFNICDVTNTTLDTDLSFALLHC
jgi:hypothetical protein